MKTNKISALFLTSIVLASCALTACSKTVSVDDLIVPTFNSNKKINIGAWSWTNKGLNSTQLKGIEDAGMNVMVGTFNGNDNDTADNTMLNNAKNYDIGFILDKRNWNGNEPAYSENENFLGYCLYDEPRITSANSIKQTKQLWDQSSLKNKMFYVNLLPSYSSSVSDFDEYIRTYIEDVGLDMVSTDYYPLYEDESDCGVGLREDWLYTLSVSAYYAQKNNIPLWYTLLTTKHVASSVNYIDPTASDLEYQMYVAMTFGATYLLHYTYAATGADHINPIIDSKGQPTDSYYDVKESSETIRKWDKFFMDFSWVGTSALYGTTKGYNSLIDFLFYEAPLNKTGALKSASSTQDVIIGQFEDKNDNKGFLVTNLTNPYLQKGSKVTLKFDSKYKGVKVYQGDEEKVYVLNSKGAIDLAVQPGQGIFVVPLKTK